ncbi:MAG: TIGR01459 family HAD-type hydrolase [Alphaproteobacteria bacterium]|nr:TIGR01459 family HAD-type hydrolase [Alphaproteobacteria bacterium]
MTRPLDLNVGGTGLPPIITQAGELLSRYDVLFCDVWGVVHDGHLALAKAAEALKRFRNGGGTVVLVSNAPVPAHQVARMLDERQLPRECWDEIVSSGDIALRHIESQGFERLYPIGPQNRDAALFEKVASLPDALEQAEAILCSGFNDDLSETAEDYRQLLARALERAVPFVCANPDLVVDVGGKLYLCAGAIADVYEEMGGDVFWAGKPYANAYDTALGVANRLRQENVDRGRVLVIGDAVRTDLKGALSFGVDALFIAGGIHREETLVDGALCADRLGELLSGDAPPAVAAMPYLAW